MTSTSEVRFPGRADFALMCPYHFLDYPQLTFAQCVILRQLDGRLKPELGLAVRTVYVHVKTRLLARKEEEPETGLPEDRRAHELTI